MEETFSEKIWFSKRTSKLDICSKNNKALKLQRDSKDTKNAQNLKISVSKN